MLGVSGCVLLSNRLYALGSPVVGHRRGYKNGAFLRARPNSQASGEWELANLIAVTMRHYRDISVIHAAGSTWRVSDRKKSARCLNGSLETRPALTKGIFLSLHDCLTRQSSCVWSETLLSNTTGLRPGELLLFRPPRYVNASGLVKRHDYDVEIAGNTRAHIMDGYVSVSGIEFPTVHRIFARRPTRASTMTRAGRRERQP